MNYDQLRAAEHADRRAWSSRPRAAEGDAAPAQRRRSDRRAGSWHELTNQCHRLATRRHGRGIRPPHILTEVASPAFATVLRDPPRPLASPAGQLARRRRRGDLSRENRHAESHSLALSRLACWPSATARRRPRNGATWKARSSSRATPRRPRSSPTRTRSSAASTSWSMSRSWWTRTNGDLANVVVYLFRHRTKPKIHPDYEKAAERAGAGRQQELPLRAARGGHSHRADAGARQQGPDRPQHEGRLLQQSTRVQRPDSRRRQDREDVRRRRNDAGQAGVQHSPLDELRTC